MALIACWVWWGNTWSQPCACDPLSVEQAYTAADMVFVGAARRGRNQLDEGRDEIHL